LRLDTGKHPLLQVFRKDLYTLTVRLIAGKQTALGKSTVNERGLATGRGTKIEELQASSRPSLIGEKREEVLLQNEVKKHGGRFLHIVESCMKQRVEGEVGTTVEIIAMPTPRHRLLLQRLRYCGIQPYAGHRFLLQRLDEGGIALRPHHLTSVCLEFLW
jgi:hypothetical protein